MPGNAIIEKNNFGNTVRFERHLPHPVEEVWKAITNPAILKFWQTGTKNFISSEPLTPLIASSQSTRLMFVEIQTSASIGNKRTQRRRKVKK